MKATNRRATSKNFIRLFLTLVLAFGMTFAACEGPQGPQGEQGQQGEQGSEGPVGPAGEDGSMMYSGEGAPGADIGETGDYYLDTDTGEMYGPKDSDGWGNPIIVLMGEDGADGQDGEDGSQIHSGSGAPDASLGVEGDYYLDQDSYELYGPKTGSGWGSPLNLKGADGNANVTRYLFPGHDFTSTTSANLTISEIESEAEMKESTWYVYLVYNLGGGDLYDHIPGITSATGGTYSVRHSWNSPSNEMHISIDLQDGTGWAYDQIEIVRIEASNTVDHTKRAGEDSIIPAHLDVSNYEEIAEYYGFSRDQ